MLLDHSTVRLGTASRTLAETPAVPRRLRLRAGRAPRAGRYSRALTGLELAAAAVAALPVLGRYPAAPPATSRSWAHAALVLV